MRTLCLTFCLGMSRDPSGEVWAYFLSLLPPAALMVTMETKAHVVWFPPLSYHSYVPLLCSPVLSCTLSMYTPLFPWKFPFILFVPFFACFFFFSSFVYFLNSTLTCFFHFPLRIFLFSSACMNSDLCLCVALIVIHGLSRIKHLSITYTCVLLHSHCVMIVNLKEKNGTCHDWMVLLTNLFGKGLVSSLHKYCAQSTQQCPENERNHWYTNKKTSYRLGKENTVADERNSFEEKYRNSGQWKEAFCLTIYRVMQPTKFLYSRQ